MQITRGISQTGTAGYNDVYINPTITSTGSGLYNFLNAAVNGTSWYSFAHGNAATNGNFNSSSATEYAVQFSPNFSGQTSTAGWTAEKINVTDGSGSGTKLLFDAQLGGVSKLNISNTGQIQINTSGAGIYFNGSCGVTGAGGNLSFVSAQSTSTNAAQSFSNSSFTGSSIAQIGESLAYTINQTGTSAFSALKIATTETAKGTGNQRLIDAYAGASGTTSEFYVDDAGNQFTAGVVKHGGLTRTTAVFNATSSVTLTAITGLTTGTLTAGASYHFRASLPCTAAASGGVQFSIGGTATATAIQYQGILYSGGAIASQTAATALGTALNSSASAVTTGLEIIEGDIVVNAAGTLLPQFAQNTSNATSSTVTQGATFEVFQTSN